jgi:hypothetical protein
MIILRQKAQIPDKIPITKLPKIESSRNSLE